MFRRIENIGVECDWKGCSRREVVTIQTQLSIDCPQHPLYRPKEIQDELNLKHDLAPTEKREKGHWQLYKTGFDTIISYCPEHEPREGYGFYKVDKLKEIK